MISIHTMELTLKPSTKEFNDLLSCAYKMAKENGHRLGYSTKHTSNDVRVDDALAHYGITVEYHNYDFRKVIKIRINPSEVLGGSDLVLWDPNNRNIEAFLEKLSEHIDDYFCSNYTLNDFIFSRVELTANLNVGKENVPRYIKLMQKIGKAKGFSPKYSKHDYITGKVKKENSFDLEGKTNGIAFTVYDKEADLKGKKKNEKAKKAKGILRIEVRLKKRKAVEEALSHFTEQKGLTTEEEIFIISKNCKNIFGIILVSIVPFGDFYKLKDAEKIIASADLKKKKKEKMIDLLRLIPEKRSLYLAFKELNIRNREELLLRFSELNVSPITISKRENVNHLKNIYTYMDIS